MRAVDDHEAEEVEPTEAEVPPSEADNVASFMAMRAAGRDEDSDDEEGVSAALAAAKIDREQRRRDDKQMHRAVEALVSRAQQALANGQAMDAIGGYTEALALDPQNVGLLVARGNLCARLNHHKATLHDGELIVKILPDSHQGHALCGSESTLKQPPPHPACALAADSCSCQRHPAALPHNRPSSPPPSLTAALPSPPPSLTAALPHRVRDGVAHSR